MPEHVFRFAEALRSVLETKTARAFDARWQEISPAELGWEAVAKAWRRDRARWERALDEVDGLLLRLLDRLPYITAGSDPASRRLQIFRRAELERLQHATAAALVAQRFGVAGLRTVIQDEEAPLVRRYFAFFSLAARHPPGQWPLFRRYLTPEAHHAFLGAATEAARFYPDADPAQRLVRLFERIRTDLHMRAFLSPRLLESLFVLNEPRTLPFFRALLTTGHTNSEPGQCEVTRALVMVKRFTGRVEPNVKYTDLSAREVDKLLREAEATFGAERERLHPVTVI